MSIVQTYKALGDPVRLKMVQRLSVKSPYTVGTLSKGLGITRQGARKHLDILQESKIVTLALVGRETKVSLNARTLEKARAFITDIERQWETRLEALKEFSEK